MAAVTQEVRGRLDGLGRVATRARAQGVNLAIHTHVNHANSVTPLVAKAARTALDVGVRDVRNQGVLMRGVDRVMVLDHGEKISEGVPSAVASDPRVIEVYLGTDADMTQVAAAEARRRAGA